jgi:hypothetical protein
MFLLLTSELGQQRWKTSRGALKPSPFKAGAEKAKRETDRFDKVFSRKEGLPSDPA